MEQLRFWSFKQRNLEYSFAVVKDTDLSNKTFKKGGKYCNDNNPSMIYTAE